MRVYVIIGSFDNHDSIMALFTTRHMAESERDRLNRLRDSYYDSTTYYYVESYWVEVQN